MSDRIYPIRYDALPLAVYREIAAHLRSIPGVEVELEEQTATAFSYRDSQVGALLIRHDPTLDDAPIRKVLDHYGLWQRSPDLDPDPL